MRLTSEEKEILRSMGYVDWDLQQIEEASKVTSYTLCTPEERVISEMEALKFLERKTFLNGLARSTFSGSAYRKCLGRKGIVRIDSDCFLTSDKRMVIYTNFHESVLFLGEFEDEGCDTITLYFKVSPRFLALSSIDYENFTGAEISMEYTRGLKSARDVSVLIAPTVGKVCINWCDFNLPYEQINMLFEIADEALKIQGEEEQETETSSEDTKVVRLIDGITKCCGFDFGTEQKIADYCPICGKKLIRV